MAQPINRQYWVNIHTEGAAWTLRINDLKVLTNTSTKQYSMSYPISTKLREGENTVSLIFAPLEEDAQGHLVQDPSTGEYLQGPKENFWVDVSIEAIDTRTQAKERIETLQLRYDMETGELVDAPNTPVSPDGERTHQTEHLRTNGEFQVGSGRLVNGSGQSLDAERADMDFRVLDPIPDFHWADEATPLEDTPQLRHELRQAYQRLHRLYERGDSEAILREGKAVWDRAGLLMAGGKMPENISHRYLLPHKQWVCAKNPMDHGWTRCAWPMIPPTTPWNSWATVVWCVLYRAHLSGLTLISRIETQCLSSFTALRQASGV